MRKIKNPKIGDYVLLSSWYDKDINDPWEVGYLKSIMIDKLGKEFQINSRWYLHCWRISGHEGERLIEDRRI